jgi:hypothetical protein
MARRAPRGANKDTVGIFVHLDREMYAAYVKAAGERDITKRELVVGALRRELADPTVKSDQGGIFDAVA